MLALRSRRETRSTHCVRCARTIAASQMNEARCARRPQCCASRRPTNRPHRVPPTAQHHRGLLRRKPRCLWQSRGRVCVGSDICAAEERRACGRARSALRDLTRRDCLSVESAANEASFATGHKTEYRRGVGAKRRPPHPSAGAYPPAALRRSATRKHLRPQPAQSARSAGRRPASATRPAHARCPPHVAGRLERRQVRRPRQRPGRLSSTAGSHA